MEDKIAIITDSCADLRPELVQDNPIFVLPFIVNFSDGIYYDGVTIQPDEVYRRLPEEMPKTSLPSGDEFTAVMDKVRDAGYNKAIAILLSSGLSGSFQMLRLMASEREDLEIFTCDSLTGSLGEAAIVMTLCRLIKEGRSWEELKELTPRIRDNTTVFFSVDTLEYLKKGGRISAAVAFAGGLLNIKPVVNVKDGVINMLGKARGSRQGNNLLAQEIGKTGGIDFDMPILLGYSGLSDALLKKYITDSAPLWEGNVDSLRYTSIGSVVGTHAGPGAIAAAFFRK